MNYGAHALDKLFFVTGHRRAEVSAVLGNQKNQASIEGHGQILLRLPDGTGADMAFSGYHASGYETIYCFTQGALKVVNGTQLWIHSDGDWNKCELEPDRAMELQLAEFCKLIRGEEADIADAFYGRAVLAVIEDIYNRYRQ